MWGGNKKLYLLLIINIIIKNIIFNLVLKDLIKIKEIKKVIYYIYKIT